MNELLQIEGLSFAFQRNVPVLDNISFEMKEGEILVLLGASGCGKTTLLNCIAGLEDPSSGKIQLKEQTLVGEGRPVKPEKRPIGVVFQGNALFPHLSVAENIKFGLHKISASEKDRILIEMLELTGLKNERDRAPHELSGGQQQRVAIARSMARKPQLLLMDEPFSDLDESLKAKLRADVHALLHRSKMSAIIVTHDSRDAMALADRIAVMKDGKILQIDTPEALYYQPKDRHVVQLFGPHILLKGRYYRPHQLALTQGPEGWRATVHQCLFMGTQYRLLLNVAEEMIEMFSDKAHGEGSELYVKELS